MKTQARLLALALVTGFAACAKPLPAAEGSDAAEQAAPADAPAAVVTKDQGPWEAGDFIASGKPGVANIEILEVHANGDGDVCGSGKQASLKYVAMLEDGTVIDPGTRPFTFTVGARQAIAGWDIIVAKMRVGDSLTLTIPTALAYPDKGTLKFNMELLSFK